MLENEKGVKMKLKEARENAHLTMEEVAAQLGITRQTYSKMESSPDTIEIGEARKLAEILNIKVDDIFFATNYS